MRCAYCGEPVYEKDHVLLNESGCKVLVHRYCVDAYKDDHETSPRVKE